MIKENPQKNSRIYIFFAGLTFILPLTLIYSYNYFFDSVKISGVELKKMNPQETLTIDDVKPIIENSNNKFISKKNISKKNEKDKSKNKNDYYSLENNIYSFNNSDESLENFESNPNNVEGGLDTTKQRILLMGDSECGGLCYQLNDYCIQNGHQLVASFVWNSATILNFAYSDTIVKVIEKYKPTYIFIVMGLNELYAKDLIKRKQAAQILAKKLDGIPYSWVGPANYTNDYGINQVFCESAQKGSFYLTKNLNLPKGGDKRHPNSTGYRIWMDSLAVWVENKAKYRIKLSPPEKRNRLYKTKLISLNAAKYRGY
jgi:hypothetical protein